MVRDSILTAFPEFDSDIAPLPMRIKIEITTRCNLACRFCGRAAALESYLKRHSMLSDRNLFLESPCFGHDMSLTEFQQVLMDLPQVQEVDLQGVGEPLINPEAQAMIKWAGQRGIRVIFTTNGTLLTARVAQTLITSNVRQITVSVDGAIPATYSFIRRGSTLRVVIKNIKRLAEMRASVKATTPRIRLAIVLTRHNVSELPDLIDLARQCSADTVTCAALKPIVPALADWVPEGSVVQRSVVEAANRAATLGIEFECEVALPVMPQDEKISTRSICAWPWLSAMVTADGYITPCCYVTDPRVYNLGHIRDKPFTIIWEGPRYQDFRRRLREGDTTNLPCHTCYDHVGLSQNVREDVNK